MAGWSLARIQREAFRREWEGFEDETRYHPLRDGPRQQDWLWAIDELKGEMSPEAWQAAKDYYHHQQCALGDRNLPLVVIYGGIRSYDAGYWARERSQGIASAARDYVSSEPQCTPMRLATFTAVFQPAQPTVEWVRVHGRPGGAKLNPKGKLIRMNRRETVDRIRWCAETLAEHFCDLSFGYGR